MAYLTKSEAALTLGFSVELIEYFIRKCPKKGESIKLASTNSQGGILIEESDLLSYQRYLNKPWPKGNQNRPHIPKAIMDDIRQESHHMCAICGHMENGEVAHIHEVSETLNNSPDNLILLCPNHHSKYDYGFKPSSNNTIDEVEAAKKLKRNSRRRIQKYEANAAKVLRSIIELVSALKRNLTKDISDTIRLVNITELEALLNSLPALCNAAEDAASTDKDLEDLDMRLAEIAPEIARQASGKSKGESEHDLRNRAERIVSKTKEVIIDIDEVECPHCGGRGQYGLSGNFCAYCGGSCFVSNEVAEEYDRDEIDEVDCPRCGGRGQTGLVGDICAYCGGDCVVTQEAHDDYEPADIDEIECPHCGGNGRYGLAAKMCEYCRGSCFVSNDEAESYNLDEIDEVECPRCGGRGTTGLVDDYCSYCRGECYMTKEEHDAYDPDEIDEVDCPHCNGRGTYGWNNTFCEYCGGSCFVSKETHDEYDPDDIDEVECPRCGGSGQTGFRGDACALCKGDCMVTGAVRDAYNENYR